MWNTKTWTISETVASDVKSAMSTANCWRGAYCAGHSDGTFTVSGYSSSLLHFVHSRFCALVMALPVDTQVLSCRPVKPLGWGVAHGKGNVAKILYRDFRLITCSDDFTIRVGASGAAAPPPFPLPPSTFQHCCMRYPTLATPMTLT